MARTAVVNAGVLPEARPRPLLSVRRLASGWLLAAAGAPALTIVLTNWRQHLGLPSVLLLYLVFVVTTAALGGWWPALAAAVASSLLVNWYFTPPFHAITIQHTENAIALIVFVVVASVVSWLVSAAARRANEARRARSEAETLARLAGSLVATDDPVTEAVSILRSAFGLQSVALLSRSSSGWRVEAHSGTPCPTSPEQADDTVKLRDDSALAIVGSKLSPVDRRVFDAFAVQVTAAVQSKQLRAQASAAQQVAAANELRGALLAGVSHDLRTPLSSIKASVTSLLQDEMQWPRETANEFLRTIDAETDRLNKIVGNLLDMSRIRTGALRLTMRSVGLDEVVAAALAGLGERGRAVTTDVRESLPAVRVDPALLERALANLVDNALTHTPPGTPVTVTASEGSSSVRLVVADHGAGIDVERRARAFEPFQRLDDSQPGGVGLGLAVARGFVDAMGGRIELSETSGGGLTVLIDLPEAT